jgi:hypothetical protein
MPITFKDLLNRRSDLSTFLVHLTRSTDGRTAADNLRAILTDGRIKSKSVFGILKKASDRGELDNETEDTQRCVCFTETPLEFVYLLVEELQGRQVRLEPYGIAITKRQGRLRGVNPIWYVDITPGHHWLTQDLDRLRDRFLADPPANPNLAPLFPFVEQMGRGENYQKEFWWEREWRKTGNLALPDKFIVLCPEDSIPDFEALLIEAERPYCRCIDPRWSLERIIGHLAGIPNGEIELGE